MSPHDPRRPTAPRARPQTQPPQHASASPPAPPPPPCSAPPATAAVRRARRHGHRRRTGRRRCCRPAASASSSTACATRSPPSASPPSSPNSRSTATTRSSSPATPRARPAPSPSPSSSGWPRDHGLQPRSAATSATTPTTRTPTPSPRTSPRSSTTPRPSASSTSAPPPGRSATATPSTPGSGPPRTSTPTAPPPRHRGMKFYQHNHAEEFSFATDNPKVRLYDVLLAETDPDLVFLEMDIYWAYSRQFRFCKRPDGTPAPFEPLDYVLKQPAPLPALPRQGRRAATTPPSDGYRHDRRRRRRHRLQALPRDGAPRRDTATATTTGSSNTITPSSRPPTPRAPCPPPPAPPITSGTCADSARTGREPGWCAVRAVDHGGSPRVSRSGSRERVRSARPAPCRPPPPGNVQAITQHPATGDAPVPDHDWRDAHERRDSTGGRVLRLRPQVQRAPALAPREPLRRLTRRHTRGARFQEPGPRVCCGVRSVGLPDHRGRAGLHQRVALPVAAGCREEQREDDTPRASRCRRPGRTRRCSPRRRRPSSPCRRRTAADQLGAVDHAVVGGVVVLTEVVRRSAPRTSGRTRRRRSRRGRRRTGTAHSLWMSPAQMTPNWARPSTTMTKTRVCLRPHRSESQPTTPRPMPLTIAMMPMDEPRPAGRSPTSLAKSTWKEIPKIDTPAVMTRQTHISGSMPVLRPPSGCTA